jgi:hypothetical protein
MRRGPDEDAGWRQAAARRFLAPLVLAIVGLVLVAATEGTAAVVGWGLVAVAVTVAIGLVFLEVGHSEERARAREERAGRRPPR